MTEVTKAMTKIVSLSPSEAEATTADIGNGIPRPITPSASLCDGASLTDLSSSEWSNPLRSLDCDAVLEAPSFGRSVDGITRPQHFHARMGSSPDVVERFRENVARWPDRPAVEAHDGALSYAELDRRSNRLAHHLLGLGVTAGSRVGVSMMRGCGELVALLAIAKAGATYVPLAPSLPLERLRMLVEDAAPQLLVVSPGTPLHAGGFAPSLVIEASGSELAHLPDSQPDSRPEIPLDPESLQYVMFTSGSTGRPKGVEIPRRAFSNFLMSMAHTPGLAPTDRLLAVTTTSFDISGLELFLPLWVGATVVIADLETARDPRLLRRMLETAAITTMQATPATWRLLLEAGWRGDGKLRILCGGESMSRSLADRLLAAGGELWNMYGPTETTVWSSVERITGSDEPITIGRPIDHTRLYVLDERGRPLPPGSEGEIGIGGRGVARGYRARPDLTRERFVEHDGPEPDRVYRTGDLGRELPDGRFEWLGRLDHQVKLRGFRVELGEIETVLRSVPGVAEVLVVAEHHESGDPRLVAYWVGTASRERLVEAARMRLPAYMIPSAYVSLSAFPMNANGKIDRKALPRAGAFTNRDVHTRRPRTDDETRIAAIWREVLGMADVPVDQDFFTLGGSSVLAIQVVARIEREIGVELPLKVFFEAPTVEGLARRLGERFSPDDPIVVSLRPGPDGRAPLFCLFGVTLYQDLALALGRDRPVVGMHVPFRYVPGRDRRPSLQEIAQRYVALVRSRQPRGPYHLLGLCFGGIVAYEVARQLEAAGERVASVVVIDAILPNGVRVDTTRRLRSLATHARHAWRDPQRVGRWLRRQGASLAVRVPLLRRFEPAALVRNGRPVDLPIDGPEVEAEIRRFAVASDRLAARLLVIRATGETTPDWIAVDAAQGWGQRARDVLVRDIPAGHLEVLQEPHVRDLARAVTQATP